MWKRRQQSKRRGRRGGAGSRKRKLSSPPAAAAADESTIVLFIKCHGQVINRPFNHPNVYWHSDMPNYGCSLFSNNQDSFAVLDNLLLSYKVRTAAEESEKYKHIIALYNHCVMKQNRTEQFETVDFILDEMEILIKIYRSRGGGGGSGIFPQIIRYFKEIEKYHLSDGAAAAQPPLDVLLKIEITIEHLKNYKSIFFRGGNAATHCDADPDCANIIENYKKYNRGTTATTADILKSIIDLRLENLAAALYSLKYSSARPFVCDKFLKITMDKEYSFQENYPDAEKEINDIFLVYNNSTTTAARNFISKYTGRRSTGGHKYRTIKFRRDMKVRGISLSEIVEKLERAGFKHIYIYDRSCNGAPAGEEADNTLWRENSLLNSFERSYEKIKQF